LVLLLLPHHNMFRPLGAIMRWVQYNYLVYILNNWVMHPAAHVSIKYWDEQCLQHTHQNLHTTDRARSP
jgi:hypothetical protein